MQRIWILTADSSRARLFERAAPEGPLLEIEDFLNPSRDAREPAQRPDAEGRQGGRPGGRADTARHQADAPDHGTGRYSRHIGDFLDHARSLHRFDRLYLVGAPRILGMMRKVLSKQAHELVAGEIPKDVSHCNAREVEQLVRQSTQRPVL
jgi:protein required for attachment to host cells